MSGIREYLQLIFPLHLSDHEFLVESVCPGEQEQLASLGFEKFVAKADEPIFPEWLGSCQVRPPRP